MNGDWQRIPFSDAVLIDPSVELKRGQPYSYIEMKDLTPNDRYARPSQIKPWSGGSRFAERDILFARITPCLENGKIAQAVGLEGKVGFGSTEFIVMRGRPSVSDTEFVHYLSISEPVRRHAEKSMSGTSGRQRVSVAAFDALNIDFPPLPTQRRIADILGALDDKIECNRRINQTLEAMAQALYKHWFVDFGPFRGGEFVDSEVGEIPQGWEVKPIGEVVETLGGGTPSTSNPAYWENGDINWYVPSDLTRAKTLFITESSKKINRKGLAESAAHLFSSHSVMMTSRATIGEISINRTEACTNQGFITLVPNDKVSLYQIVFWLRESMEMILGMAHGATFKEITRGTFRTFPILIVKDADVYVRQSKALFDQIESNIIESAILTRTRDYLLPKLLSGEVEVKPA